MVFYFSDRFFEKFNVNIEHNKFRRALMKKFRAVLIIFTLLFSTILFAKSITETLKVKGMS